VFDQASPSTLPGLLCYGTESLGLDPTAPAGVLGSPAARRSSKLPPHAKRSAICEDNTLRIHSSACSPLYTSPPRHVETAASRHVIDQATPPLICALHNLTHNNNYNNHGHFALLHQDYSRPTRAMPRKYSISRPIPIPVSVSAVSNDESSAMAPMPVQPHLTALLNPQNSSFTSLPTQNTFTPNSSAGTPSRQTESKSRRRPSFSFLHRSKSVEKTLNPKRSFSGGGGGKLVKRTTREVREREQEQERVPDMPPVIPFPTSSSATLLPVGGNGRHSPDSMGRSGFPTTASGLGTSNAVEMVARPKMYGVPIPPVPASGGDGGGGGEDGFGRRESMAHRGRYSYASSFASTVNSPRRVRRRREPVAFNILILGASNAGKTSFIDFLRTSLALPPHKQRPITRDESYLLETPHHAIANKNSNLPFQFTSFTSHYLETLLVSPDSTTNGGEERIGLTIWDSEGLEDQMVDLQVREITGFIESKFEETFGEEVKTVRAKDARDTHIHAAFLLLDPGRMNLAARKARKRKHRAEMLNGTYDSTDTANENWGDVLDEGDIHVLRSLRNRTTVIPIITKADTVTATHMMALKRGVWNKLKREGLDPMESLGIALDDGDQDEDQETENADEDEDDEAFSDADGDDLDDEDHHPRTSAFLRVPGQGRRAGSGSGSRRTGNSNQSASPDRYETSILDESSSPSNPSSPEDVSSINKTSRKRAGEREKDTVPPLPLSVLVPDPADMAHVAPDSSTSAKHKKQERSNAAEIGRKFAWGVASPYDEQHCDFVRIRDVILGEWRAELREKCRDVCYEGWRTERLNVGGLPTRSVPSPMPGRDAGSPAIRDNSPFPSDTPSASRPLAQQQESAMQRQQMYTTAQRGENGKAESARPTTSHGQGPPTLSSAYQAPSRPSHQSSDTTALPQKSPYTGTAPVSAEGMGARSESSRTPHYQDSSTYYDAPAYAPPQAPSAVQAQPQYQARSSYDQQATWKQRQDSPMTAADARVGNGNRNAMPSAPAPALRSPSHGRTSVDQARLGPSRTRGQRMTPGTDQQPAVPAVFADAGAAINMSGPVYHDAAYDAGSDPRNDSGYAGSGTLAAAHAPASYAPPKFPAYDVPYDAAYQARSFPNMNLASPGGYVDGAVSIKAGAGAAAGWARAVDARITGEGIDGGGGGGGGGGGDSYGALEPEVTALPGMAVSTDEIGFAR